MGEGREGEKNEEMSGEENWGEGERNGEERKAERLIQFLFSVIIPYSKNYFFLPSPNIRWDIFIIRTLIKP